MIVYCRVYSWQKQLSALFKEVSTGVFYKSDFYCANRKLITEFDRKIHYGKLASDHERDLKLSFKGIFVLRIKNEVLGNLSAVTDMTFRILNNLLTQQREMSIISGIHYNFYYFCRLTGK